MAIFSISLDKNLHYINVIMKRVNLGPNRPTFHTLSDEFEEWAEEFKVYYRFWLEIEYNVDRKKYDRCLISFNLEIPDKDYMLFQLRWL